MEPNQIRVPVPKITKEQAKGFGQVWNKNNPVILLLDDKTLQFAVDFAQIVLKSYVMDQVSKLVNQKTSHPDGTVTGKATIDAVGKIADMAKAAPQNNLVTLN